MQYTAGVAETLTADLRGAIAGLYREFGDEPLPRTLVGCDHCTDPSVLAHLAQTPPSQLSLEDLDDYVISALNTVGDEEDFKHFFPRLFELATADLFLGPNFELIGEKLTTAKWQDWPASQQAAVRHALEALWGTLEATEYELASSVDAIVCGVALARLDVLSLLTAWSKAAGVVSKVNLTHFMEYNRESLWAKRRLANAFWDGSPSQEVVVADWLRVTMGVH